MRTEGRCRRVWSRRQKKRPGRQRGGQRQSGRRMLPRQQGRWPGLRGRAGGPVGAARAGSGAEATVCGRAVGAAPLSGPQPSAVPARAGCGALAGDVFGPVGRGSKRRLEAGRRTVGGAAGGGGGGGGAAPQSQGVRAGRMRELGQERCSAGPPGAAPGSGNAVLGVVPPVWACGRPAAAGGHWGVRLRGTVGGPAHGSGAGARRLQCGGAIAGRAPAGGCAGVHWGQWISTRHLWA